MPRERKPRETGRREATRCRVCFVTGTRAEFGLMQSTLRALRDHPAIELQIIATGMHLHASRGSTLREIRRDWTLNATVPWREDASPAGTARAMGQATAKLVEAFETLKPDIVIVVGDRVEAFAAASAAHVSGRIVVHVHGGDRAMGQVDDALRHAISKLSHLHFPATKQSGERLHAMGEDAWRIRVVGSPGVDNIRADAANAKQMAAFGSHIGVDGEFSDHALLLLHPTDADDRAEAARTRKLIHSARAVLGTKIIALLPNNDPGADGIAAELRRASAKGKLRLVSHAERPLFLGLLRDCRVLIGNSSAGIIEAGSFAMPVLDIGPRQQGRERGSNVRHVEWHESTETAVARVARSPRMAVADNPYDRGGAARRIVMAIASLQIDDRLRRKVIRY